MKFMYSDILLKKNPINFINNRLFGYCVGMVSMTLASRYVTSASRHVTKVDPRCTSEVLFGRGSSDRILFVWVDLKRFPNVQKKIERKLWIIHHW